jgi:hypothetical protein
MSTPTANAYQVACEEAAAILSEALSANAPVAAKHTYLPESYPLPLTTTAATMSGGKVTLSAFVAPPLGSQPSWIEWTQPAGLPTPTWTALMVGTTGNQQFPHGIGWGYMPYTITDDPISAALEMENAKVAGQISHIADDFLHQAFPASYAASGAWS